MKNYSKLQSPKFLETIEIKFLITITCKILKYNYTKSPKTIHYKNN